jgi:AraC-like DNA-binding protein
MLFLREGEDSGTWREPMLLDRPTPPFSLLAAPYSGLIPLYNPMELHARGPSLRGAALVWSMARGTPSRDLPLAASRPGGLALLVILPPGDRIRRDPDLLDLVERCRPQSILPFHPTPDAEELARLLAREPQDLPAEVTDYLIWRGLRMDGDTRRLVRRTLELAGELKTIAGLARSLYLSRRALGRRFLHRGLPVPSHWLQFGRVLRAAVHLQTSNDSLFTVASAHGYPDGFALSNQMYRLTGVRPSTVRERLGWEWIVEAWLEMEVAEGGLPLPPRTPEAGMDPQPRLAEPHKARWAGQGPPSYRGARVAERPGG